MNQINEIDEMPEEQTQQQPQQQTQQPTKQRKPRTEAQKAAGIANLQKYNEKRTRKQQDKTPVTPDKPTLPESLEQSKFNDIEESKHPEKPRKTKTTVTQMPTDEQQLKELLGIDYGDNDDDMSISEHKSKKKMKKLINMIAEMKQQHGEELLRMRQQQEKMNENIIKLKEKSKYGIPQTAIPIAAPTVPITQSQTTDKQMPKNFNVLEEWRNKILRQS